MLMSLTISQHEDDLLSYNEYNYWYINPPEVQVEDLLDVCDVYLDDDSNVSSEDIVVRLHFFFHYSLSRSD